jgi:RNA polymerase sigma factor (sigma-70 family)
MTPKPKRKKLRPLTARQQARVAHWQFRAKQAAYQIFGTLKWSGPKPDVDDLIQAGCIGIILAVKKHKKKSGPFSAYAYSAARDKILREVGQHLIRLPDDAQQSLRDVARGRRPKLWPASIRLAMQSLQCGPLIDSPCERSPDFSDLYEALERIHPDYRKLLVEHFGLKTGKDKSFSQMAKRRKCTRQNVQQKYHAALKSLRRQLTFEKIPA